MSDLRSRGTRGTQTQIKEQQMKEIRKGQKGEREIWVEGLGTGRGGGEQVQKPKTSKH